MKKSSYRPLRRSRTLRRKTLRRKTLRRKTMRGGAVRLDGGRRYVPGGLGGGRKRRSMRGGFGRRVNCVNGGTRHEQLPLAGALGGRKRRTMRGGFFWDND